MIPQFLTIAFFVVRIIMSVVGIAKIEKLSDKILSAASSAVAYFIMLGVLYWGGFFNCFF